METPKEVIRELEKIRNQSEQGVALLAEAEIKYLELASAADRVEATELLSAQGTIVDRQAVAKLKAMDVRFEADMAKVELSRIKAKIRHLSESQMAVMAAGKLIQMEWRG